MKRFLKNIGIAGLIVAWISLIGFFEINAVEHRQIWAITGFIAAIIITLAAAKTLIDGKT